MQALYSALWRLLRELPVVCMSNDLKFSLRFGVNLNGKFRRKIVRIRNNGKEINIIAFG